MQGTIWVVRPERGEGRGNIHGSALVEAASRRFLPAYRPQNHPKNAAGRRVYWPVNGYQGVPRDSRRLRHDGRPKPQELYWGQ